MGSGTFLSSYSNQRKRCISPSRSTRRFLSLSTDANKYIRFNCYNNKIIVCVCVCVCVCVHVCVWVCMCVCVSVSMLFS